ncbi:hypothetical protein MBLNU230_g7940t1 [Neophaeotheca triangularis]
MAGKRPLHPLMRPSKLRFSTLPNRSPEKQNTATMPEPSNEDIENVMSFAACDHDTATRYLKVKDNNIEAAVNSILDGEDISKEENKTKGWDESVFSGDREGEKNNNNNASSTQLHALGASAAPTRGNSPAPSLTNPTNKADEDSQLAAAMAASREQAGMPFQQETGVVSADGQQFGPANRDQYDPSQWALTTTASTTAKPIESEEIIPDLEPEQRKHEADTPRFLKHSPFGDYLPNLLTICHHAVPGAREALLLRQHVKDDYGQDEEWWRGHTIAAPRIVNIGENSGADSAAEDREALLMELQRLMALLDASDRSYASAEALRRCNVLAGGEQWGSGYGRGRLEQFVKAWEEIAGTSGGAGEQAAGMFQTVVGTSAAEGMVTPRMEVVEMAVKKGEDEHKPQLQELLDDLLWDTDPSGEASADNWIEKPADVLVMRVYQQDASEGQVGLEIPAAFHVDKYLKENVEATRAVRKEMMKRRQRLAQLSSIEDKLKYRKHPTIGAQLDALAMLRQTQGHFSGRNKAEVEEAAMANGVPATPTSTDERPAHYPDTAERLQGVIDRINDKLVTLASEKEKTRKAISEMSKTPPPELQSHGLKYRYTLRGVSTKPHITYVLHPAEDPDSAEDAMETQQDDDTTPPGWQWWRIDYEVQPHGSGARANVTKTADYDVLRAVELEHKEALLVYASDRFSDITSMDPNLPHPLHQFIQKDDAFFHAELQNAAAWSHPESTSFTDFQAAPLRERRFSNNSTTVQGGDSPPSYDDVNFDTRQGFGLPPAGDIKQGEHYEGGEEGTPVHEIHLDDGDAQGEMVERDGSKGFRSSIVQQGEQDGGDGAAGGARGSTTYG